MNKNMRKILSYIGVSIIFLLFGIFIGKNINLNSEKQAEPKFKTEKIAVSTFIISNNIIDNSISANDLIISDNLFITLEEIINSNTIKNKVKEKYSNINNIELEQIENMGIVKAIYICDNVSETECININNNYVSLFASSIENIYNINVSILDGAVVSTRIIEENN